MKIMLSKALVLAVIVLFIGAGFVPGIAGMNKINQNSENTLLTNVEEGDVDRWAIAMGFSFDGIMHDAYCLKDILHNNSPDIWPLNHIKLYSHDSWDNIIEGLRLIEAQEDSNDITIWQSAGHGNTEGIASENGFISYADLDREFDKFDGSLLIMICNCVSCYAHTKLAGDNRIIITGRTPLDSSPCNCQKTDNSFFPSSSSLWTYFIMHFVHPLYGAWGNEICDSDYGNNDGWVSAEEAFAYVEDTFEWPDEILNNWCYTHLYMTDGLQGNLNITYLQENNPPSKPDVPEGALTGRIRTDIEYIVRAYDPDGDDVFYLIDWGDNTNSDWIGPLPSGDNVEASYTWAGEGTYEIRVLAKDDHGVKSEWSDPLSVSMPKNKAFNLMFLQFLGRFMERFPLLEFLLDL